MSNITPPPELLQLWFEQHHDYNKGINELLIEAVQYGADRELEACCELMDRDFMAGPSDLRAARRPKPPSLKEQALAELAEWENVMDIAPDSPIRRALGQLDD
jgi:hypothetical protein